MTIFDVNLYEPIDAVVTADTTAYTADNSTWPTADGGILEGAADHGDAVVNANVIFADLYEPVVTSITADTTAYTADNAIWPTADGGLLEGATDQLDAVVIAITEAAIVETANAIDQLDAEVISVPVEVGGYYPPRRPFPVEGVGYGILPQLEGEGVGIVIIAGPGIGTLPKLIGAGIGAVGVVGRSAAQLVIRAAAVGDRGAVGTAVAVLKDLSIASDGAVGAHGSGSGTIVKFEAIAIGRHNDDEAAVMTFLFAA